MSFQQGLSGLNATSKSLEVIGNNIANASTYGAKASRAEFSDVYSAVVAGGRPVGMGVQISTVSQQFSPGNIAVTDGPLDLAISGEGFFQVARGDAAPSYTRNGQFKVVPGTGEDIGKSFIADNNGLYLMGIPRGQNTPGPLTLPPGRISASATRAVSMEINLPSRAEVLGGEPATVADLKSASPKMVNEATSQVVFDGKGQSVPVTYYFRRVNAIDGRDAWAVYMTANDQIVPAPAGTDPIEPAFYVTFDRATGGSPDFRMTIDGEALEKPDPISIPAMTSNGASFEAIPGVVFDLSRATQIDGRFGVTALSQDGYVSGQLKDFQVDEGGRIIARYTNGESLEAGRVLLVRFANPQGLQPIGGNLWASTAMSGSPTANSPGEGGAGVVQQGALEQSNVDLTAELVNMITAQRAYQANAQTIKTIDQVMQTLVNMR
jgi:flagellar hook protein FlgE